MIAEDNFSRNNSGLLLAIDLLLPVANAALLWRLRVAESGIEAPSGIRLGGATSAG